MLLVWKPAVSETVVVIEPVVSETVVGREPVVREICGEKTCSLNF